MTKTQLSIINELTEVLSNKYLCEFDLKSNQNLGSKNKSYTLPWFKNILYFRFVIKIFMSIK